MNWPYVLALAFPSICGLILGIAMLFMRKPKTKPRPGVYTGSSIKLVVNMGDREVEIKGFDSLCYSATFEPEKKP